MRKTVAILAYLSLIKREVLRETLAAPFWAEYDQQRAYGNFRRNLSSILARLGPEWFSADRDAISINTQGNYRLDVDEFIQHVEMVRKHGCKPSEGCQACMEHLVSAETLYRGDFLEGFNLPDAPEFDEWQYQQREELRNLYAFSLERLAQFYSARQDWERAIEYAHKWVSLDSLNESAQRTLIELFTKSGNRSAALRQYEGMARAIKDELGQEPEQASKDLHRRILAGELRKIEDSQETPEKDQVNLIANQPVLKIKNFIPSFPGNRVKRSRLLALLQASLQYPWILISAPAGFGKTTALSEWASSASIPIAWFSIDEGDNDHARFLTYLISALEGIQPGIGSEAQLMLRSFRPISAQNILAGLNNHLFAIPDPFVLIMDDYHLIASREVHQSMIFLLDHLPPQMHVIISTRSDPPFPLSRYRARERVFEIRTNDLRFTQEESSDFLNRVMELDISEEDISVLENRTEGWAAGLQLAGLSIKGRTDIAYFIRSFTGSHRFILDYLVEEVLSRQPENVLTFLLQTSILERFNYSLCNAITGQNGSQQILEALDRENMFLVPLDDERQWYRYHHLFAELLQARLLKARPEEVTSLHKIAGRWFEEQGFYTEATEHAFAAKDFYQAARLVEMAANSIWFRNEAFTLAKWLDAIPQKEFNSRPGLNIYKAWVLLHDAHFEEAGIGLDATVHWMEKNETAGENESDRVRIRGMLATLRAIVYANLGKAESAILEAKIAIDAYTGENSIWRCLACIAQGFAYTIAGNFEQANQTLILADAAAKAANDPAFLMLTQYNMGALQLFQARPLQASEYYWQVLSLARKYRAERLHELGEARVDLGWVLCEWNKLVEAEQQVLHGLEIGYNIGSMIIQITGHLTYARILQAQGKRKGAFEEVR